jgi:predicted alpha/beta-fold hydrolase
MPIVYPSTYVPPPFLTNYHFQSIYPFLFRQVWGVGYERERIATPDDDFLDLDWSKTGSRRLAILSHGLEGHSRHSYMMGMVKALNRQGISALSWNFRGCSGELNRKHYSYHAGLSGDLEAVIKHVQDDFDEIYLIGFSLGGNLVLKYLGECGDKTHPKIKSAVAISAPIDLKAVASVLHSQKNAIYFRKFMWTIEQKLHAKAKKFPLPASISRLKQVKSFKDLDDWFTAPMFGYKDAEHLWRATSSLMYLDKIRLPTLLLSAADDPILTPICYPTDIAQKSPCFYLEVPEYGGHVGFMSLGIKGEYWSETRTIQFIDAHR